jgi:hypothetical protein
MGLSLWGKDTYDDAALGKIGFVLRKTCFQETVVFTDCADYQ